MVPAHLETSLALVERAADSRSASIIDIGAGESTLVDDLLAKGYENITVLDVSQTALEVTKKRLGLLSEQVNWIAADITQVHLEPFAYDVWHDRAVFHFLTSVEQRAAYVRNVAMAVNPGGHVIVSTSVQKVRQNAADLRSCATMPNHCTTSLARAFVW